MKIHKVKEEVYTVRIFLMIVSVAVVRGCTAEESCLQRGKSVFYFVEQAVSQTCSEGYSPVFFDLHLCRTPFGGVQLLPPKNLVMITVRKLLMGKKKSWCDPVYDCYMPCLGIRAVFGQMMMPGSNSGAWGVYLHLALCWT